MLFKKEQTKLFAASDARNEVLDAILWKIKELSKNGYSRYERFDFISDKCINALKQLGYEVEKKEFKEPITSVGESYNLTSVDDIYIITW
jgi:hypothetical protein